MDWRYIFKEAVKGVANPKCLEEVEKQGDKMREEWVINSLRQYITRFSITDIDIKRIESYCIECEEFYRENLRLRKYHFGYPANMLERTPLYDLLSEYERMGFLSNNCGDTFEKGNYRMDSKEIEI